MTLLRERGYLSHGLSLDDDRARPGSTSCRATRFQPSASGHSLARVGTLFTRLLERETDPRAEASGNYVAAIGDDEQFAVAVALIARELGFPSRVVLGARLTSADPALPTCENGRCRAQDIAAWTEVQDEAGRWVPVDVTPQHENSPSLEVTEQRDPENVTEVRPDSVEEVLPPDPVQEDSGAEDSEPPADGVDLAWLGPALRVDRHRAGGLRPGLRPLPHGHPRQGDPPPRATQARRPGFAHRGRMGRIRGCRGRRRTRGAAAPSPGPSSHRSTPQRPAPCSRRRPTVPSSRTPTMTADEADEFWRIVESERRLLAREGGAWHRLRATVSLRSFVRHLAPSTGRRERTAEREKRRTAQQAHTSL